jgi:hypothetical protein
MEWSVFYQLEPFGSEADFMGHAITAATVANANRPKGKAAKVKDFMPRFEIKRAKKPEELFAILKDSLLMTAARNKNGG